MTRHEYRKLFDGMYPSPDKLFGEKDDRLVVDHLMMFFGFSEPKDYFVLPKIGQLAVALGNFDEAFRVGGISEFLENCGYCVPDLPEFFRRIECEQHASLFDGILANSDPQLWGYSFFAHEYEVTEYCRANGWFRVETQQLRGSENDVLSKLRGYLEANVDQYRDFKI